MSKSSKKTEGKSPQAQSLTLKREQESKAKNASKSNALKNESRWATFFLPAAVLIGLVLVVYWPTLDCGFIWDDDDYVTANPTLRDWIGLKRIWLDPSATPQYYPLVHSSLWLDYHIWGLWAGGYHGTNFVLHAITSVLTWLILRRLQVPAAWFGAVLFAVHPVHVESVAWITERKNVLSGVFALSAMLAVLNCFTFKGEENNSVNLRFYWLALAFFCAALLSKTVTCTLPIVVLIVMWYRQCPQWRLVVALMIPWILLGGVAGLFTAYLEKSQVGARGAAFDFSLVERVIVAGRCVWFYWQKLVYPNPLMFMYPRWNPSAFTWMDLGYPLSLVLVFGLLVKSMGRIGAGTVVAAAIFVVTIFPAIGFFNVYPFRYSFVADHFQYLASIAPLAWLATISAQASHMMVRTHFHKRVSQVLASMCVGSLMMFSWAQTQIYHDPESLWLDTLSKNPNCFGASFHLGKIRTQQDRYEEATRLFERSLANQTDHNESDIIESLLANSLSRIGRIEEAKEHYDAALKWNPKSLPALNGLGKYWVKKHEDAKAITYFRQAIEAVPTQPEAHVNLANALLDSGDAEGAEESYKRAIELDPKSLLAHMNLGRMFARQRKFQLAAEQFAIAIELAPNSMDAKVLLAKVRSEMATPSGSK